MENVGESIPANWDDYVTKMRDRMEKTFRIVRDQHGQAFQRAKHIYDERVKKLQFKVDDLVLFFCPRKRPRLGPKWQLLTSGPWRIEKVLNSVNYVIRRDGGSNRRVVHIDRLRRFDEVARDGVVPASQSEPDHPVVAGCTLPRVSQSTKLGRSGGRDARISANLLPVTIEVDETPAVTGRPQRLRTTPARLRNCRQLCRMLSLEEGTSDEMNFLCSNVRQLHQVNLSVFVCQAEERSTTGL